MKRARDDLGIPDWYMSAMRRKSLQPDEPLSPTAEATGFYQLAGLELLHDSKVAQPDVRAFLRLLQQAQRGAAHSGDGLTSAEFEAIPTLFDWTAPLFIARAPGRLDVMGGIADYSGSLVLQMPIAEASIVAVQLQPADKQVQIVSFGAEVSNRQQRFEMDLESLFGPDGKVKPYTECRALLCEDHGISWAAYIVGCLVVLLHEQLASKLHGMRVLIHSQVPEGKGVSSSAALEVSMMSALTAALGIELEGRALALLCQKVENKVVGAPCGVMDQMASALGQKGKLLALLCQPAEVQGFVEIPACVKLWGVDSGVTHSVGGSDYSSVRTAAFMGKAMLNKLGSEEVRECLAQSDFLSALPQSEAGELLKLPGKMAGQSFLGEYGGHGDQATVVEPETEYSIMECTRHPIEEGHRVKLFRQLLTLLGLEAGDQQETFELLGELMLQSHASYSRCGLGSQGTDSIVRAARAHPDLFGAKITGGGSGGTVCVLGRASAGAALHGVADEYAHENGHCPYVFEGSSAGAVEFGHLCVKFLPADKPPIQPGSAYSEEARKNW